MSNSSSRTDKAAGKNITHIFVKHQGSFQTFLANKTTVSVAVFGANDFPDCFALCLFAIWQNYGSVKRMITTTYPVRQFKIQTHGD